MPGIRTFIAIETEQHIRDAMENVQTILKSAYADVRWEPAAKLHATIKFLGNVQPTVLPSVLSASRAVVEQTPSFQLTYEGIGCFPSMKSPRIVWIGCTNKDGTLTHLKNHLDDALLPLGFEIEKRDFHPHITIGRVKGLYRLQHLISMIEKVTFEPHIATVTSITVMKSTLKPEGSEYSVLEQYKLKQQ